MDSAHFHLLLNHIPVLGTMFGLLLLTFAMFKKSRELKQTSLAVFVITALVTIPVYISGGAAEEIVESLPEVSETIIEQHEDAAFVALWGVEILGVFALAGLFSLRNGGRISNGFTSTSLLLATVIVAVMAWTANLGGQINHPELRSELNVNLEVEDD